LPGSSLGLYWTIAKAQILKIREKVIQEDRPPSSWVLAAAADVTGTFFKPVMVLISRCAGILDR
jgi:hypothetical protein